MDPICVKQYKVDSTRIYMYIHVPAASVQLHKRRRGYACGNVGALLPLREEITTLRFNEIEFAPGRARDYTFWIPIRNIASREKSHRRVF